MRTCHGPGLGPALAGIPAGWCAALALTRLLSGLLYGVAATDPAVFTAVRIEPAATLRPE